MCANYCSVISLNRFLELVIQNKMYSNRRNLIRYFDYMFGSLNLSGKRVLDIGGGAGLLTFYAVVKGAEAICLEPEFDGCTTGMIERFNHFKGLLPIPEAKISSQAVTFNDFEDPEQFDVIIMANSINHLDESACEKLHFNQSARQTYLKQLKKMYDLLKSNGRIIVSDCNRRNFFNDIGLKSPFMPSIEWRKHQPPCVWLDLMHQVGFQPVSKQWTVPNSLGKYGSIFLANPMVAYFLLSHFRIEARKL